MRVWRLVGARHVSSALSGEGAALFGGRWNPVGRPTVYTADSLALATLELIVNLTGARARYVAIEVDIADSLLEILPVAELPRGWADRESTTQAIGARWLDSPTRSGVGLVVPSVLVDQRSGERNVLLDPRHASFGRVSEVQRFEIVLDARL